MPTKHTGACFCGAVSIEATGEPVEMGYCRAKHCRSSAQGRSTRHLRLVWKMALRFLGAPARG